MFSNTENNSANDKVNTRPRLKAYLNFISNFFNHHQQSIALLVGYLLVAGLFFNLGKFTVNKLTPDIRIEEPPVDLTQIYNNLKSGEEQSLGSEQATVAG